MGKPTAERPHGVPPPTLHLPLDQVATSFLFQLVSRRYTKGSIILTSNKSYPEWGAVCGDEALPSFGVGGARGFLLWEGVVAEGGSRGSCSAAGV